MRISRWAFFLGLILLHCRLNAQINRPATATAVTYNNTFVVAVTVTDGGAGYAFPPSVNFNGVGSGAAAYSVISNGAVTQIVVTNAGNGYYVAPTVSISAPTEGLHSLDAGSGYVSIPDSASLNSTTNALTVECWFNIGTPVNDWTSLVSKEGYTTDFGDYDLRVASDQVYGLIMTTPSGVPSSTGNSHPTYPAWHHAAMQYDLTNYTVWVDGSLVYRTTNYAGHFVLSTEPVTIGSQNSGFRSFNGYIAEVRISKAIRYTTAFNPETRFDADTNTVALYHFDEGGGSLVHDSSGNGNDGAIFGASAWSTNVPMISPVNINLMKAVYVSFSNLQVGTNYQLQISTNLHGGTWSSVGLPFTATNTVMTLSNYWNVCDWNQLYFQLLH